MAWNVRESWRTNEWSRKLDAHNCPRTGDCRPSRSSGRVEYSYNSVQEIGSGTGFCCESEEQFVAGHAAAMEEATRWWLAAARQGYWPALDNLVTSGVGAEAKRTSEAWNQLEKERGDLVGSSHGMTVYGPEFVQELSRRLFGRVIRDEDGLKVEMERGI